MKNYDFPFAAIVEQTSMKTVLLLNAVDPSIGGALIRGHKGTGKSSAVRGVADLLPDIPVVEGCPFHSDPARPVPWQGSRVGNRSRPQQKRTVLQRMPFVELPLNATEDRLVGSLHIEKALRAGSRVFEPGLLAQANRGLLYVDEVNLLEDHLVDMLLDAAASGVNVVEREGLSFVHPARFILVGTMNPEEGELRPQFLDRFGLCVSVETITDAASRELILRRHLAHERGRELFCAEWERAGQVISDQIVEARNRLERVALPDDLIAAVVRLTRDLGLQGHRADATIVKAARAHAAFLEKPVIDRDDLAQAARLAVPHRIKPSPLQSFDSLRQRIDDALEEVLMETGTRPAGGHRPVEESLEEMAERMQVPGSMAAGSILFSFVDRKVRETVFEPDARIEAAELDATELVGEEHRGQRRSKARIVAPTGRYFRARPLRPTDDDRTVALDATLRRAALRSLRESGSKRARLKIQQEDLCRKEFRRARENLIVFLVDTSESMGSGAEIRIKAAKGAALALLRKAYESRGSVALVAFGGDRATVVLAPTSSVDVARSALERLPTGGATPFADALWQGWQLIRSQRTRNPGIRPILVVISDGEANVPIVEGAPTQAELDALSEQVGADGIAAVFIDATRRAQTGKLQAVAARMNAAYVPIRELTSRSVLRAMQPQMD
jgi:magnesium chelatase subunit D